MATSQDNRYWVGFDLGGTKMLAKVFDSDFKSLGRDRTKTKGYEGADAGLARIVKTIHRALEEAGVKAQHVAGIGIGCPGPLDLDRGVIHNAPNLGWSNVAIKEYLETKFDCPVIILNDVEITSQAFGTTQIPISIGTH